MEGLTLIEQYLEVGVGLAEPTNARLSSCNDITIFLYKQNIIVTVQNHPQKRSTIQIQKLLP
jgi:hypothetical protein